MKKWHIIIITVVVLVLFVLGVGIQALIRIKAFGLLSKGIVVRVEQAQRGELIEFVSAPGEIEPKTKVEISAKVMARIVALPYEEGDVVTCGNPDANPPVPASELVRLDAKDLESQLLSAQAGHSAQKAQIEVEKSRIAGQQAGLVGLEASLKQAERDLERQKGLLETQDISQATFDQTQLKVDDFKAQYDAAKHTLEAAKLNLIVLKHNLEAADARITQAKEALSYTTITSPMDGVVTRLNAEVGELVITGTMNNPGTVIMEVADLSQMLVVAQVDEADVGKMKVGQKAKVHVDAFSDNEFTGVVDSIALAHTMSRTLTKYFRTEILLDTADQKLYSGLTAHVDIETHKHFDILKVPTQAVLGLEVDNLPLEIRENSAQVDLAKTFATIVYRYVDGKAVVTPIKIGQSDMTHTIVKEGITVEDKIVAGPYKVLEKLVHGQKIRDERELQLKKKKKNAKRATTGADANQSKDDRKG
ncbi:MAG: HlyD family efflux transporter periplasmic adaptor subunit [Phycisphaerae bacterium]|nr:HlyD family efflux transporter periplasmic adaptor subunit [Phycisphaerae bacterium]NIP50683.1 HlyD family efflux transporter periplasmic adaptor subunit [Phycisphaerae bacterium]NIS52368.1 HlyD family efflux transporter periplasmic adaptor subunit [Phycisphaerae bacterium]NIU11929.1 HlyD family efflux transporter periplasmic adaptor subunit [Phycisphaerae bacterium]NIU57574.1 HlyD family efflux transporter periplasmic adaptor subunit [Phycisphaerae bacterium]